MASTINVSHTASSFNVLNHSVHICLVFDALQCHVFGFGVENFLFRPNLFEKVQFNANSTSDDTLFQVSETYHFSISQV